MNKPVSSLKKPALSINKSIQDLHISNLYDRFFYDPKYVNNLLQFFNKITENQTNLAFIELFSGIGKIGQAVINTLPQFSLAHLYEINSKVIEKGSNFTKDKRITFFASDLSQIIQDVTPVNGLVFIGAHSHELLLTPTALQNLAINCSNLLTSGSQIIFRMVSLFDMHDAIANTGKPDPYCIDVVTDENGIAIECSYTITAFDPLTHCTDYNIHISDGKDEQTFNLPMRNWSLAEITRAFAQFDFLLYSEDCKKIEKWESAHYKQPFYLVGKKL